MMTYRPDIDALRGIAVLSVLLFHLGVPFFSGGFVGVDVFFVISGYVIAKTIQNDLVDGKFSILKFYNKRIRRIFPALFAMFSVSFIAAYVFLLPHLFDSFAQSLIASSLFVSNMYFWRHSGYFEAGALSTPLLHTWSLSVEEQYYIFFPVLAFIVFKYLDKKWLTYLLPVLLLSFALSIYATGIAPTANFFFAPTRVWELLIGAILALKSFPSVHRAAGKNAIALTGLGMIAAAVFFYDDATPFPGLGAILPCVGTTLVIYGGQSPQKSLVYTLLANRLLLWFGLISYSLYLVHWPLISFYYLSVFEEPDAIAAICLFAVATVLAYLSWRYIEQPFRKINPDPKHKGLIYSGLGGMAIACIAGGLVVWTNGIPARYPDYSMQPSSQSGVYGRGTCFFGKDPSKLNWDIKQCTLAHSGKSTEKALLWGDSFAAHYSVGIKDNASIFTQDIIQYTAAGCPPDFSYYSFANKACSIFNNRVPDIIRTNDINTVIVAARWSTLRKRGFDGLRDTIDRLKSMGVSVYVIGQSPEFSIDTSILAYFKGSKDPKGTDFWKVHSDPIINDELRSALSGSDVHFIDPLSSLCKGSSCPYRIDGTMLFSDFGHFNKDGSDLAAQTYFPLTAH